VSGDNHGSFHQHVVLRPSRRQKSFSRAARQLNYAAVEAAIQALYLGGRNLSARVRTFLDFVARRMREADINRSCQYEGVCYS
jgi:hypothetical protein